MVYQEEYRQQLIEYKQQLIEIRAGGGLSAAAGVNVEKWLQKHFEEAPPPLTLGLWNCETYAETPLHLEGMVLRCWDAATAVRDLRVCLLPEGGVYFAEPPFVHIWGPEGRQRRSKVSHTFVWPSVRREEPAERYAWESAVDVIPLLGRELEACSFFQRPGSRVSEEAVCVIDYVRRGDVSESRKTGLGRRCVFKRWLSLASGAPPSSRAACSSASAWWPIGWVDRPSGLLRR